MSICNFECFKCEFNECINDDEPTLKEIRLQDEVDRKILTSRNLTLFKVSRLDYDSKHSKKNVFLLADSEVSAKRLVTQSIKEFKRAIISIEKVDMSHEHIISIVEQEEEYELCQSFENNYATQRLCNGVFT